MKKITNLVLLLTAALFIISCSSSKNATDLKVNNRNLAGLWTISDITVNMPADFKITDVFDEASYEDFKGSKWNLIKNGKGSFTLENGISKDIYWSVNGKGEEAQLQFKKLMGEKARNVDTGYRLNIDNLSSTSFTGRSILEMGDGKTGNITYTFTK